MTVPLIFHDPLTYNGALIFYVPLTYNGILTFYVLLTYYYSISEHYEAGKPA